MNKLSEKYIYDLSKRAKDKSFGRKHAEEKIRMCGEITKIEDICCIDGSGQVAERRYYHGNTSYYSSINFKRSAITPLEVNPMVSY